MDNEETPAMWALARMTVAAESDLREDWTPPAVPPGRMADFQREWRERPCLRALIRAAGALPPETARRNRNLAALHEMSQSREWRREPGGRLSFGEFFTAGEVA